MKQNTRTKQNVKAIAADIGIDDNNKQQLYTILSESVGTLTVFRQMLLGYHWNVKGSMFTILHSLFGEQYDAIGAAIDIFAERIRQIGLIAPTTLAQCLELSTVEEIEPVSDANEMVANVLAFHEIIIQQLRTNFDLTNQLRDFATNNIIADLLQNHEKTAWVVRAILDNNDTETVAKQ
jgi:starvation-inducible DNA-binding protein